MQNSKIIMNAVLDAVLSESQARNIDAAYLGQYGNSTMEKYVEYYKYGAEGQIPPDWQHIYNKILAEYNNSQDPEYTEYQRLKNKFEKK